MGEIRGFAYALFLLFFGLLLVAVTHSPRDIAVLLEPSCAGWKK